MVHCNVTLSETHWETEKIVGNLNLHTLGWIICGACAIIATIISFFLIFRHATHYTKPNEQKHIIRILLMIPIYAITSWLSYVWYWHAIYWEVARDCYEAFAIASFFTLLCAYVAPDLRGQKDFFASMDVKPWPWPITWINKCMNKRQIRKPRNGLTWFNLIWMGVFQYIFIRVATTAIATATQATGNYCEESLHPAFAHLWCMIFNVIAVTIAMYCLIAFYLNLKRDLAANRPFFKLLCIKLVIFFSFWQMILLDFLVSAKIIKPSKVMSQGDISVGFNSLLICFEMIIFATLHLWAFAWKDFDHGPGQKTSAFGTLLDAFNPWDTICATARGLKWMLWGWRKRHRDVEKIINRKKESQGLAGDAAPMGITDLRPLPGGLQVHHPTPADATEDPQSPTERMYDNPRMGSLDIMEDSWTPRPFSSQLPHHPEPTRADSPHTPYTPQPYPHSAGFPLPYPDAQSYIPQGDNQTSYTRPRPQLSQPSAESLLADDQTDPSFRYTPSVAGSSQEHQGDARLGMQRNADGQWDRPWRDV
ncbi:organic solute transporter Ostalpha-domain-containing protein [Tuber indicum]|nr:organic solute transporter Ostalpha-domain-containing protein [Tuber indicum]